METNPRVSICCSVLNQSEWLRDMIQSVVNQTFKEWELIVVDDGSTEDVKSVVDSFKDERILYHRFLVNRGIPFGANHALKMIRGEYFGLLAADETIDPNKLEDQVAFLDADQQIDGLWGIPGRGDFGRRPEWEQYAYRAHNRSNEAWLRTLVNLEGVPIGGASFLMRRKVLDSIGYLDENLTLFSDHEFYCRFFEKHIGRILPFRWAKDRELAGNGTSVRERNFSKAEKELEYVRGIHPIQLPVNGRTCTIAIPVFNMEEYVLEALKSAQNQTYKDLDIIVMNDGSTDNTVKVVQDYLNENPDPRVRIMGFDENHGLMNAMNNSVLKSKGQFFTSLAADDTISPDFVEKCRAEFNKNPWLEMVGTQTDFMDALGKDLTNSGLNHPFMSIVKPTNKTREEWLEALKGGNQYFGVSMYRTRTLSEVGGWEERFEVIADYEMYLRLLQRENIKVIEEPLTHTRIHGKNMSLLKPEKMKKLPEFYHQIKNLYYPPRLKVIIATPFYELKGFSPYIWSLTQTIKLMERVGISWDFLEISGDSYVHKARNIICERFLRDPDATDLFFIDSDMSWNPESFVNMLTMPEPVLGGSYPVKNRWGSWTSRPETVTEGDENHYIGRALPDGSALIKADVIAGGFLRIKRKVLTDYPKHYPDLWFTAPAAEQSPEGEQIRMAQYTEYFASQTHEHVFYGEDHMFSKRMRDMGVPMFIYPNVNITHWGYKGFDGNYHEFLKGQTKEHTEANPRAEFIKEQEKKDQEARDRGFKGLDIMLPKNERVLQ